MQVGSRARARHLHAPSARPTVFTLFVEENQEHSSCIIRYFKYRKPSRRNHSVCRYTMLPFPI